MLHLQTCCLSVTADEVTKGMFFDIRGVTLDKVYHFNNILSFEYKCVSQRQPFVKVNA